MEKQKTITSRVPAVLVKNIKTAAKQRGRYLESVIAEALSEWLARNANGATK